MASVSECLACRRPLAPGLFCAYCGTFVLDPNGTVLMATRMSRLGAAIVNYLLIILTLGIGWIIWWLIVAPRGQNPGKAVVGLRVIRTDGRAATTGWMFVRGLFSTFSVLPLDSLWLLWDRDAQTLHDKLVGTVVVRARGSERVVSQGSVGMVQQPTTAASPVSPPVTVPVSRPVEASVSPPVEAPEAPLFSAPVTLPRAQRSPFPQPASPGTASAPPTAAQELVHLMELRDKGLITEEEYQAKRKVIVDRI